MTREQAKEKMIALCSTAVADEDYSLIKEAEKMSYEYDIEMVFDDEYVLVEDEMISFNGVQF